MKRTGLLLGIFLVGTALFGCAPKSVPEVPAGERPSEIAAPVIKTGWEAEWEKTLEAAKKEGKVVVYGGMATEGLKEGASIFKRKYGIDIDLIYGRGAELRTRLLQERANGLYIADVFIGGLNTIYDSVLPSGAADLMEPELIHPEVRDPKVWYGGKLPWADKEHKVFLMLYYPTEQIAINTEMVKHEDINSYFDLLNPRWKGKIVIDDPTISGSGFNSFSSLLLSKIVDIDFMRKLVNEQNGVVLRDRRLQVEGLARGKYYIALWPAGNQIPVYKKAGAPVDWTSVKEGTYLSVDGSAVTLMIRRPNPSAARIFINWFFGKEGQILTQKAMQYHSAREDLPTDMVDPLNLRKPGRTYFLSANDNRDWVVNEQDKYLELAREIFGIKN